MAMPPYSLTAWRPRVPSVPVPERMMQTAWSPWSAAREREEMVDGRALAAGLHGRGRDVQDAVGDGQRGIRAG